MCLRILTFLQKKTFFVCHKFHRKSQLQDYFESFYSRGCVCVCVSKLYLRFRCYTIIVWTNLKELTCSVMKHRLINGTQSLIDCTEVLQFFFSLIVQFISIIL